MFLQHFKNVCIFLYFIINVTSLCFAIYFVQNVNTSSELDLVIWLIIATTINIIFGLIVIKLKRLYPYFKFLHFRLKPILIDSEMLIESENFHNLSNKLYTFKEKISIIFICILYVCIINWTIFGIILSVNTSIDTTYLKSVIWFQLIASIIYFHFSFILIFIKFMLNF